MRRERDRLIVFLSEKFVFNPIENRQWTMKELEEKEKEKEEEEGRGRYFLTNDIKPSRLLSPLCLHFPPYRRGGGMFPAT